MGCCTKWRSSILWSWTPLGTATHVYELGRKRQMMIDRWTDASFTVMLPVVVERAECKSQIVNLQIHLSSHPRLRSCGVPLWHRPAVIKTCWLKRETSALEKDEHLMITPRVLKKTKQKHTRESCCSLQNSCSSLSAQWSRRCFEFLSYTLKVKFKVGKFKPQIALSGGLQTRECDLRRRCEWASPGYLVIAHCAHAGV